MEHGSTSLSTKSSHGNGNDIFQPKHKVFLSHSGAQKGFVEQLCVDLERYDRRPFFDKHRDCLPIGKDFPKLIFEAIEQCEVGVVVVSEEFFTSKWPMLELVAMINVQKRRPSFTIMPILLGMTLSQCRDASNHKRWLSLWHTWAVSDSRIDVKEWEHALRLFGPINALKYNIELGEVTFREEIVKAICALVPPGTRFDDSHIQGRSRLCKVIHETIKESRMSSLYGVHIVGLHGVGGIGKTTICKAMCNTLSDEYRNKVAYIELGSRSEEELLKEVLVKLTDKNLEALDVDKYRHHLMRDMMNAKVFLTIDNVSSATTHQALTLLRANYGVGSVVLVTARSLNELMALRIDTSDCMEMPELEMKEARSLFLYHASCVPSTYSSNEDDLKLISSCVERCHFKKGDGISEHYHPLALQVLGEQLGCVGYNLERWWSLLHELDFLNPFGEPQHPVFFFLRSSFDALNPQDQLLFMDAALFAPYKIHMSWPSPFKWSVFEWLGMVHGIPVQSVMERLENLKRKSVLENLGDGFGRIGMHDLWREFARLETKVGEFDKKRWMFEWDEYNAVEEGSLTNGGCLVNVRRMFFLDKGFMKLEDVNFSCFPNVTVLKLSPDVARVHDLDLRGLRHLKSLELECFEYNIHKPRTFPTLIGLGSLLKLRFLRWSSIPSNSPCIDEIVHLTNLQVLELDHCVRSPDLSSLVFLQMACFRDNALVVTIVGLSSKHTNLQYLDLSFCWALQSCPGVGELVALQELCLFCCYKLKEVPNLQKLKRLRKLNVINCRLLAGLPGLGDLVSLLELNAGSCTKFAELPDMRNLQSLRILDLSQCSRIESLPGLNELVCLQSLKLSAFKNLAQLPDIYKLTNLQTLKLDSYRPLQSCVGWSDLILLRHLDIGIDEVHDGFELRKLTNLETLHISRWQGRGFSGLSELVSLESVTVRDCQGVCVLPDLDKLSRLRVLKFWMCDFEDLSGLINLTNLEMLEIVNCEKLDALPDLRELARLEYLTVQHCARLIDVRGILGLRNLKKLRLSGHRWLHENLGLALHQLTRLLVLDVSDCGFADLQGLASCSQLRTLICRGCLIEELPDLANFLNLEMLDVGDCGFVDLQGLASCSNLRILMCSGCPIQELPDLANFLNLEMLDVRDCGFADLQGLASCSRLRTLKCIGCPIQELPDLANFLNLEMLNVRDCVNLTTLTCMGPLSPEFRHLDVHGCMRLQALPDLTNAWELQKLDVSNSGVVLSAQLIQDMVARYPSIDLITQDSLSRVRRHGSSLWI